MRSKLGRSMTSLTNMKKNKYTKKVIANYQISDTKVPVVVLRNYITLKLAYAEVNFDNGKLSQDKFEAIQSAIEDLQSLSDQEISNLLPIDRIQSGGGTSTNMPINEAIAFFDDGKDIHPNDHVNMSQSSNDTFPGVAKITFAQMLPELIKSLQDTINLMKEKVEIADSIDKVGRTHLQDALRMTVGEEFSAFISTLEMRLVDIDNLKENYLRLPLGATAIGTKQNINDTIRGEIIESVSRHFYIDFTVVDNYFAGVSTSSDFQAISASLAGLAIDLTKICNDLRLLASGPRSGLGEIRLPEVQAGSSIMPGKVNPSIAEALNMACFDVLGKARTVEVATMHAQLQLQQFQPIIVWSIYDSLTLLTNGLNMFNEKLLKGLVFNTKAIKENLDWSLVRATELSEELGYDEVARRVKEAIENGSELDIS